MALIVWLVCCQVKVCFLQMAMISLLSVYSLFPPDGNDMDEPYPYGITSLADKRDFLQKDDVVRFQVARTKKDGGLRAVNIGALRKFIRAKVDSVKGQVSSLAS